MSATPTIIIIDGHQFFITSGMITAGVALDAVVLGLVAFFVHRHRKKKARDESHTL